MKTTTAPLVALSRGDASITMTEEDAIHARWSDALALLLGTTPRRGDAARPSGRRRLPLTESRSPAAGGDR